MGKTNIGVALCAVFLLFSETRSYADPVFVGGTSTITHTPDTVLPPFAPTVLAPIPAGDGFQHNTIDTRPLGGQTAANAGIRHVERPTAFGLGFERGTGISQLDPKDEYVGPSTLRIDFDADWTIAGSQFGPFVFGGARIPLLVNLGTGDSAAFKLTANFERNGAQIRAPVVFDETFTADFSGVLFDFDLTNPVAFGVGDAIKISGFMEFSVENQTGPASIKLGANGGTAVPEPGTLLLVLLVVGVSVGIGALRRHRELASGAIA